MAVSDKEPFDFNESLSVESTKYFEICCDPCLSEGHTAEAKGFCVNCQESLCKFCLDAHRRLRVLKHHQVEDKSRARALKSTVQQGKSNICTEVCTIHSNEIIKFFCKNHKTLGCSDCVTLNHRTCRIDYIPDMCTGIIKSNEFKTTLDEVTEKLKQSDDFRNESNSRLATIRESITDTIKQIEDFQKKMNQQLNTLKNKMTRDIKLVEYFFDKHVHESLSRNDGISSELKLMKEKLETSQTNGQSAQAFTFMKQAQTSLKTLAFFACKDKWLPETRTYNFEPNEALVDMLSTSDGLGRIVTMHSLKFDKDINVRGESDAENCDITGCALLVPGKLVITDAGNYNVKIVDVNEQSIVEEYSLPDYPADVAVLPHDQVAVALHFCGEIQILKTREKLTMLRIIKVNRECWGIAYHQGLLYVLCWDPNSVLVLDMQGTVHRDILLQLARNETFRDPCRISISKNLQQMYISDYESNMVVSLTLQGEVTVVYQNNELKFPLGITALEDGSLLVCCHDNGAIHHISADLTQGREVAEGVDYSKSIYYDSNSKTVYVTSFKCDDIHALSLK